MNSIDIFPWDENFNTGLPLVDEQHRRLVDLLNQLASHVAFRTDAFRLETIFDELADYARYHFQTEEAIWQDRLGGEAAEVAHRGAHADFVKEIGRLRRFQVDGQGTSAAEETLGFLARWLASHILESDRYLAYAAQAVTEGLSRTAALERAKERMGGATRALIDIILSIYSTLSTNTLRLMRELAEHKEADQARRRSEERLKIAMGTARQAWFEANVQTGELELDPRYEDLLGYEVGELIESLSNWLGNIHPEDQAAVTANFEALLRDGGPISIEYRRRCKNGDWLWFRSTGIVTERDGEGRPSRISGIHMDVSDRKRADLEAAKTHALLAEAVASVAIGFTIYDDQDRLV
ncbi:MAG: bacteriohemerythrin, partial [Rhodocyclaceae bacterium]|nr:bacteriohemerythrin [Rhodocyclaceae bacterium]